MQGKRRFRPGWIPVLVTGVMLSLLLSLGTWQLRRAAEKQQLLERYQMAPTQPAVGLDQLGTGWQDMKYRLVKLTGQYDEGHQLLMENQIREGVAGYWVLTPYAIDHNDQQQVVLVNRGWLAGTGDRKQLPDIQISSRNQAISGLVSTVPSVGIQLGSLDQAAASWPKVVPYVDLDWLQLQLGKQVKPWVLQLAAGQPDGYVREWRPAMKMGPDKHRGYAATWFSLAGVLIILFVAASLRKAPDDEPPVDDARQGGH